MEQIFFNMMGITITISIIVIILLLLSSYLDERYAVKWRYFIWLILAIRLILPVDFGLTDPPLEMNFNDQEIPSLFSGELLSQQMVEGVGTESGENLAAIQREGEVKPKPNHNPGSNPITVSGVVTGIYFLGVAAFLLWQFGLYLSFRHATRRWYREPEDAEVRDVLENLKAELGIKKNFKIMVCRKIISPMIVGLFKPTLLLPHEGYQKIDLNVILKHELIHIRRNDLWFKLLLIFANALHWFNPFIYIMVREANKDIEISCDEEVLKGADLMLRKRYSDRILELMQWNNHQEAPVSTNFNGGKGMMKSRICGIFDERVKKRGIVSFCLIAILILVFSACSFEVGQDKWKIPISMSAADTGPSLSFDLNRNGTMETAFSLITEGESRYLKYEGERVRSVRKKVLEGTEPGAGYSLQAANLEDGNSIVFLVATDYRGMPFGSGYWELYSWDDGRFQRVDIDSIEANLQVRIMERYPGSGPAAGLFFKDELKKEGEPAAEIYYAPMSEYDVEGFRAWGQDAINKTMTGMKFVSGEAAEDGSDSYGVLLETEEVVFITLPNITATVKRYYQYRDGEWTPVDTVIE